MVIKLGEVQTDGGQTVRFDVPYDLDIDRDERDAQFEKIKEVLGTLANISLPSSHEVNVKHGGYGRHSRYDLDQLEYQGGGNAYYEVLHVKDAPNGRHPFVSNGHHSFGEQFSNFFAEWETTDAAIAHAKSTGGYVVSHSMLKEKEGSPKIPGLIRAVDTGYLSPWFYATGDAEILGDFVFPEHLAQDPIFTVGKQFLVPETSEKTGDPIMVLKTCMGCVVRDVPQQSDRFGRRSVHGAAGVDKYRAVQWHDGSVTQVYPNTSQNMIPVPLADEDTWVVDAQRKFNQLLSGGNQGFEVKFADGGKFVGRYIPPKDSPKPDAQGRYMMVVTMKDGSVREGWTDFTPTDEHPTVISYVQDRMSGEALRIEAKDKQIDGNGKKWQGVYHASSQSLPSQEDPSASQ